PAQSPLLRSRLQAVTPPARDHASPQSHSNPARSLLPHPSPHESPAQSSTHARAMPLPETRRHISRASPLATPPHSTKYGSRPELPPLPSRRTKFQFPKSILT